VRPWYQRVIRDPDDLHPVLDAVEYFTEQYEQGTREVDALRGERLIEVGMCLPGLSQHRAEQLAELDAIIAYLQIREDAAIGVQRRFYVEHYNRKLTDRMVEKFAETHPDVLALRELCNHVALVRNKFTGLLKRHEYLHYQLSNIARLWAAGKEDALL
jgi:hypothetical protein